MKNNEYTTPWYSWFERFSPDQKKLDISFQDLFKSGLKLKIAISDICDLDGQYVKDAIDIIEEHLYYLTLIAANYDDLNLFIRANCKKEA